MLSPVFISGLLNGDGNEQNKIINIIAPSMVMSSAVLILAVLSAFGEQLKFNVNQMNVAVFQPVFCASLCRQSAGMKAAYRI